MGRLVWAPVAGATLLAACGSGSTTSADAPACHGVSPTGLTIEQTPASQCPATPSVLTGTGQAGAPCSDASACAPACCSCPSGGQADVAECVNGSCLDAATACCLYDTQCAN
jgi:hypothetical protein